MLTYGHRETLFVIGDARTGGDLFAREIAKQQHYFYAVFHADGAWEGVFKDGAGVQRNTLMVDFCDFGYAWWDGVSAGTKDTVMKLRALGKLARVFIVKDGKVVKEYGVKKQSTVE